MKALIGVMPEEQIRKRMLAIAKGEHTPAAGEPKIWFTSVNAVAQVLSNENIALLRQMDEQRPETLTELAEMAGRQKSNLSVTLKTLAKYGFIRLEKTGRTVKPVALFTDFDIRVSREFLQEYKGAAA
ncbi:MarR family transcriptional regulator [Salmonella enterica]|uniref:Transcriptional regulator n=1 Tax=Salmonella enterica subsp. enterica serovar Rough O:d:1,7 TaxID=1974323 RepID=A0A974QGU7_SALET|nr:MarR family transcriptional regulator [Salmonella enterica]EBW8396598.1 MarR family transcriptional regulator [Salmonella enterica subsp. enterica serovar Florida]EHU0149284.1 MarR family transcriptional regulator [Salmonella enterica subsp. enterica serovar Sandiego]ECD7241160.1 MarR family transcriptional regulator [Salmonella enterica subsp. enterica serovar Florida]ECF4164057.1 MarR family transcriptional regulator [Salmonella enterica subsp. enterica serovar Florida]ECR1196707.1 MarR f